MSSKKRKRTQAKARSRASKHTALSPAKLLRQQRAKLKELGLLNVDLRAKVSKRQAAEIARFADVLAKKATVIDVGKKAASKFKARGLLTKGGMIVVKRKRGEKVTYSKTTETVITKRKDAGLFVTRRIEATGRIDETLGPNEWVILPAGSNEYPFKSWKELDEFMRRDTVHNAASWRAHAYTEEIEDEELELLDRLPRKKRGKRVKVKTKIKRRVARTKKVRRKKRR